MCSDYAISQLILWRSDFIFDPGPPLKAEQLQFDADVFDSGDGTQVKTESKHVKVEKTEVKSEHGLADGVSTE